LFSIWTDKESLHRLVHLETLYHKTTLIPIRELGILQRQAIGLMKNTSVTLSPHPSLRGTFSGKELRVHKLPSPGGRGWQKGGQ